MPDLNNARVLVRIAGMTVRVQVAIDAAAHTENPIVQNSMPSPPPPPDLRLFGLDLTPLSPFANLLVGALLGVFVCYLIYGILHVKKMDSIEGFYFCR